MFAGAHAKVQFREFKNDPSPTMSRSRYLPSANGPIADTGISRLNSPWRLFGALALAGALCFAGWHFLQGPVRVSRPTLGFFSDHILASSVATNDTDHSVRLSLKFTLGRCFPAGDESPASFNVIENRHVDILVQAHSTNPIHCEFDLPQPDARPYKQLQAEVRVVSCR